MYKEKEIAPTKAQIRIMIGRWNPRSHSHTIQTVIKDIQSKTLTHQLGQYEYWTEQRVGKRTIRYNYQLVITENKTIFYDEYRNNIYALKTK